VKPASGTGEIEVTNLGPFLLPIFATMQLYKYYPMMETNAPIFWPGADIDRA
jgi:hypothetical protein